ncbi:PBP1A family penicillin-binding protein [Candidatus Roizmanbacteria bacterium]|nr:PBP1A family penicillin-binding protein [Candidatus Roizmanbacteria bacterium]
MQKLLRTFFYCSYLIVNLFITIGEFSQKIVLFPFTHIPRWGKFLLPFLKILIMLMFHFIQKTVSFIIWIILLPYRIFVSLFSREFRFAILGFLICLVVILFYSAYQFVVQLPSPKSIGKINFAQSTHLYDRNGKLLYEIYRDENRTPIKVSELPAYIKQAAIAIEDKDFFKHNGVSLSSGVLRALRETLVTKSLQGGSTITQQLVKSSLLTPERTFQRKIKEIILALWTEKLFSKEQILEMYLNQVPYGGSSYGIEEAAKTYFGKHAIEMSLEEAALLAGLPQAPSIYSPYVNPDLALQRRNEVLKKMREQGFIDENERVRAQNSIVETIPLTTSIKAPHFVFYTKSNLEEMYGERTVEEGGLNVVTTLDLDIQEETEKILREELEKIKNLNVSNGAILITKPSTGEILAMVGSADYFAAPSGAFNVTTALRQPGSSIKPLMYSLALEKGFTAATILDDSPISFSIPGSRPYQPVNYDGTYHGRVPLRFALANSFNIPAVRALNAVGVDSFVAHAKKMGISTWDDPSRFGLSLTLGGGEVHMTDMATAFGVFANGGNKIDVTDILKIQDTKERGLYELRPAKKKVLDEGIAYIMSDILSDNFARRWAFGTNSALEIPGYKVAVKTGTTDEKKDNWTIGYTPEFLVAVWVGNNDNTPMNPYLTSGITGAAPIWNRVMKLMLTKYGNNTWFQKPTDITEKICYFGKIEYFLKGTEAKASCRDSLFGVTPSPTP